MFARCIIAAIVSECIERIAAHVLWVFSTVQMVLMSGLSRTALEDLSSEKLFEDRIPHVCNILKFAVLKKDHSFMAIGGSWDPTDGTDPSVDQSSLIQTMLRFVSSLILWSSLLPYSLRRKNLCLCRHTKDKLNLDLSNCRHWNPFLEVGFVFLGLRLH